MAFKGEDTYDACHWCRVDSLWHLRVVFTEGNARGACGIEMVFQSSVSILLASLIFLFICVTGPLINRLALGQRAPLAITT